MADSNRTGQRLLDSIRKAKAGEETAGDANASPPKPATPTRPPAPPASKKTTARKATPRKATAKPAAAKPAALPDTSPARPAARKPAARGATTGAPYPLPGTTRPQPSAYPGAAPEHDPFRSPGRVWPD